MRDIINSKLAAFLTSRVMELVKVVRVVKRNEPRIAKAHYKIINLNLKFN